MSVIAQYCTPGVKPPLFSGIIIVALGPSRQRVLSLSSSHLFSSYSMSCHTRCICCCWRSMTSWLWAVAASTSSLVSLELPALAAAPWPLFAVSGVSMAGAVWSSTVLLAWPDRLSTVLLAWPDQSVGAIVSLCSDVAVCPKVLSNQYVRGWVYDDVGHTVVEWGVVARVTMITIDKQYCSGVSN